MSKTNNLRSVSIINNMKCITAYNIHDNDKNYINRNKLLNIEVNDVLNWIKAQDIDLAPYQESMIVDMCNGTPFMSARGVGRTFVANLLGAYIASLFSENNYNEDATKKYSIWLAVNANIVPKSFINTEKAKLNEQEFRRKYSLGYEPGEIL